METLKKVKIFQDCEKGLLVDLVLKLKLQVNRVLDKRAIVKKIKTKKIRNPVYDDLPKARSLFFLFSISFPL